MTSLREQKGLVEKSDEGEDLGITDESASDEDASDGGAADEEVA